MVNLNDECKKIHYLKFVMELPEPVICINNKGVITHCNVAATTKVGHAAHELIGNNVTIIMHSDDANNHDKYIERYLKTRVKHIFGPGRRVVARHKNGKSIPLILSVTEQKSEEEVYFIGLLRDLSEIEESKTKLDAILNVAPSIIMFIDANKIIRFINHTTGDLKIDEVIGSPISKFQTEASYKIFENSYSIAKETGECINFLTPYISKDGATMIFEAYLKPVYEQGLFNGVVIVTNEVTKRLREEKHSSLLSLKILKNILKMI